MDNNFEKIVNEMVITNSENFEKSIEDTVIILAAGHGKRIKSNNSKMLHKIWDLTTIERVYNSCVKGFKKCNSILVVGIKANDVMNVLGKKKNTMFANQPIQNGTGHAVQIGLSKISDKNYKGTVYVFPGDMGLLDSETVTMFKKEFKKSKSDMMVLTGIYKGKTEENSYGRIIRVKEFDINGTASVNDFGKVIEIIEYKDILKLSSDEPYILTYNKRKYSYTKDELINNNEFNSGVYAFKNEYLGKLIKKIKSNNAQNEIYITDLIDIFNKSGLSVNAVYPKNEYVLMGFNDKSVLLEMNNIARNLVYEKIKNIISIEDPNDFFIEDNIVSKIISLDKKGVPLNIKIGKGCYLGRGVVINYNLTLGRNVKLKGNIVLGENLIIGDGTHILCSFNSKIKIGDNVQISNNNNIAGKVTISKNSIIENGVRIIGTDENPTIIGENVIIKGISKILNSKIGNNLLIEHSVIENKKISKNTKEEFSKIRFYLPEAEGKELVKNLK